MPNPDERDRLLIQGLQRNGRASIEELAQSVGLSRTAARSRVKRLLDSGAIRVVGMVHPEVARLNAIAHVSIVTSESTAPVATAISKRSGANFVSRTAGSYGVIIELRMADDDALLAELNWIRSLSGVRRLDVFRMASVIEAAYATSRPRDPINLDDADWELLRLLETDGRLSYVELADAVGFSQASARTRVMRLQKSGTLQISAIVNSRIFGAREAIGVGVRVAGAAEETGRQIAELPHTNYVIAGFGHFDLICSFDTASRRELMEAVDQVRSLDSVLELESWLHLEIVKETYPSGGSRIGRL